MLHLHLSHRIERLRGRLLAELAGPRDDPLVPDTVIVASAAMQRWLTLALADAHGICTRVDFPFLAQWLWLELRQQRGGPTPGLALTPAALAWRVWRLLGDDTFVAAHPRLAAYLHEGHQNDPVLRFELAERAAQAIDQVIAYRPRWLETWSRGHLTHLANDTASDQPWQAGLWQRIAEQLQLGQRHPLAPLAAPAGVAPAPGGLQRGTPLHLFALPAIAPYQVELLAAAAAQREVHVYAVNPCREYWFDLVPPKFFGRIEGDTTHEVGHPLLAAWGRQTQALIDTLFERVSDERLVLEHDLDAGDAGDAGADAEDVATAATAPTLLAQLQQGIRDLVAPTHGSLRLADGDRSVEIHHAHSLTRELEVLHDRLLGLMREAELDGHPLAPGDILVATPDLAAAAPLIDAVFGTVPASRRLPYTITGLPERRQSAPARVLLALLALLGSRASATELFSLLQEPLVARRFALDEDALALVHGWLREAGLHWGLDAAHREALGLSSRPGAAAGREPPRVAGQATGPTPGAGGVDDRHTLADALQRLLLGHLLPDQVDEPFAGRLPAGAAEGSKALVLGALARFADALRRLERQLRQPRGRAAWLALLLASIDVFIDAPREEIDAVQALRAQLAELAETQGLGGLGEDDPIPFAVLRRALAARLDEPARGGVPSGSVCFAAMAGLRHLPYRVIAVIGLNGHGDSAFPRPGGARGLGDFDLIAAHPQRGDRQRRLDERNLFLDLLMAARGHLHLSCTARSVRDNAPLAPSVLLDELLELLLGGLAGGVADADERDRWRARLVVEHPLQAFSTSAFLRDGDPRRRSHDAELARALQGAARIEPAAAAAFDGDGDDADDNGDDDFEASDDEPGADDEAAFDPPFFSQPLAPPPTPAGGITTLGLDTLGRFLHNPSRHLLRQRLQIQLPREEEALDDDEPFLLDRVAERRLADRLLPRLIGPEPALDEAALHALAWAGPEVPAGAIGRQQLEAWLNELQAFAGRIRKATALQPPMPAHPMPPVLRFETPLRGRRWVIEATPPEPQARRLVLWRFDKLRATDQLDTWLWHLMLQQLNHPAPVCWIARDHTLGFTPVADPGLQLTRLLAMFDEGQQEPLPFHVRSAEAFVRKGLPEAEARWRGSDFSWGEREDPARELALRGHREPLGAAFRTHAQTVFGPLLEHEQRQPAWEAA